MNGLDDLRGKIPFAHIASSLIQHGVGWTLKGAIQSHVDVYVSQATLGEVNRSFPYMVSKEFASGGGDVIFQRIYYCGSP